MKIVRHHDRDVRAKRFANATNGFFVGLRIAVGHHRPMEREQDAIELRRGLQACDQAIGQGFVGFPGERGLSGWQMRYMPG